MATDTILRDTPAHLDANRHPLTLAQFHKAEARDYCAGSGVALADYMRHYGRNHNHGLWWSVAEEYAKRGGVFRPRWLDTLSMSERVLMSRHHRDSIPDGYIFPEYRR